MAAAVVLLVPTLARADSVYWSDAAAGTIRAANLDGTGSPSTLFSGEGGPMGVAIDPGAGRIYWSDDSSGKIRVGNLDGTGASDLFTGEMGPTGVAIDPAAGKIYWGATASTAIRVGSLNGTGASNLFSPEGSPFGVAIDPAAGKIYWGSYYGAAVRVGNLNGTGASNLFSGESQAEGVALDSTSGKIYWAINNNPAGRIRTGSLNGGAGQDLFTGEPGASYPALLRAPVGVGAPLISRGASSLSCSQGSWAPDLLGSFLYRAPQSFAYSWSRNGAMIRGASSNTLKPRLGGNINCTVSGQNQAGSTPQTSHALSICVVPNLKHKALKRARKTLRRSNCRLGKVGGPRSGKVKKEKPKAGTILAPGSSVKIKLR